MKSQLAVVLVVLSVAAYVSAGGYGGQGFQHQQYYVQPQIYAQQRQVYAQQPIYAQYAQPQIAYGTQGGLSGGLSGGLGGGLGGGYGGGSNAGSIIPIIIICKFNYKYILIRQILLTDSISNNCLVCKTLH